MPVMLPRSDCVSRNCLRRALSRRPIYWSSRSSMILAPRGDLRGEIYLGCRGADIGPKTYDLGRRRPTPVEGWLPPGWLPERRLVEAAKLARVQPWALFAQQVHGGDADLQVLAD